MRASFFENDKLTHRDFLGSLMGSGIKRETVGDIYVGEGSCDFLVLREILPYVLQNLGSAGRTKLHLEEIELSELLVPQQSVKTVRDTVPSLRLDGIVSSGFSISRGKAADYIAAGKAELNYLPCTKGDKQVARGGHYLCPWPRKDQTRNHRRQHEKEPHQHRNFTIPMSEKECFTMEKSRVDRINELAHKAKTEGLTEEETIERDRLRQEYLAAFRQNLRAQLDNTYIVDDHGNKRPAAPEAREKALRCS